MVTRACSDLRNSVSHSSRTHNANNITHHLSLLGIFSRKGAKPVGLQVRVFASSFAPLREKSSFSNARSPSLPHSHRQDTTKQFRAAHCVSSAHTRSSSTISILIVQWRGQALPHRRSRLPFPDRAPVRASPQPQPLKTLRS